MIVPRQIFLMALSCALAVAPIYYAQPLLPRIASSFGLPAAEGSVIATLTQFGYAAGLLLFVPLADSIQPRKLASLAVTANAIALIACTIAPTFYSLAACSFLVGISSITAQIIIPAVSGGTAPAMRGQVVGSLLGGLSSGVLLARTVSGLIGGYLGWRSAFAFAGAADLALLVVIRELPPSPSLVPIHYRALMHSLTGLVRDERMLRIAAAMGFLMFAAFSALWATLASLLVRAPYHYGPVTIGAFGLVGLFGLLISPRLGAITDRVGTRAIAAVGAITHTVAFVFIAAGEYSLASLIAGMVLADLGTRASFIANQARIYTLRTEARSRLNTVYMVSYFLGGAFGAALGGAAAQREGWLGLAAIGASLTLAALAVNELASRSNGTAPPPTTRPGAPYDI